jgi:hypothetical protein
MEPIADISQIMRVEGPSSQQGKMERGRQDEGPPPVDHKSTFRIIGFLDQSLAL